MSLPKDAHMRTTFPVWHLCGVWTTVVASAFLVQSGWWDGLIGYAGYGVAVTLAGDYGREKYRYQRYAQAERAWKAFVQDTEEK